MINGVLDTDHPAVGAVRAGNSLGTGVLISPSRVLTSAVAVGDVTGVKFVVGNSINNAGDELPIKSTTVHPAYDEVTGDHDLAILELGSPASIEPLPLLAPAQPDAKPGMPVTILGYGVADENGQGSGYRRRGTVMAIAVDEHRIHLARDPVAASFGDAGGPVLVHTDAGVRVAAIIGRVSATSVACTRVLPEYGSGFFAPVVQPSIAIHGVGVLPPKPLCGYPMTVVVALTGNPGVETALDLHLVAVEPDPQHSSPLPPVLVPAETDRGELTIPAILLAGRTYVLAATLDGTTVQSDPIAARAHAVLDAMTIEPATVPPESPFSLTVTLAEALSERIDVPIEIMFPNGDATTIGVGVEPGEMAATVTPVIGAAPGVVTFSAGFGMSPIVATLTVSG